MCFNDAEKTRCNSIDPKIVFKQLPTQVIVKNFIQGEEKCNYEIFLLELLNSSFYFQQLSKGESYCKPHREEKGQSDAISRYYEIDFKLCIAESKMKAASTLSYSITKNGSRGYSYGISKVKNEEGLPTSRLFQALRNKSLKQLEAIVSKKKRTFYERDIAHFLKILMTRKNLLLFCPYEFDITDGCDKNQIIRNVVKALYFDLKESILYREKHATDFDTYLVTIVIDRFIICKIRGNGYKLVDCVPANKIKTFERLMEITPFRN